jgi:hypothetical protein
MGIFFSRRTATEKFDNYCISMHIFIYLLYISMRSLATYTNIIFMDE